MNARIVNLRTARKRKTRAEEKAAADERAAEHGRSKDERDLTAKIRALDAARLDGHKREDDD